MNNLTLEPTHKADDIYEIRLTTVDGGNTDISSLANLIQQHSAWNSDPPLCHRVYSLTATTVLMKAFALLKGIMNVPSICDRQYSVPGPKLGYVAADGTIVDKLAESQMLVSRPDLTMDIDTFSVKFIEPCIRDIAACLNASACPIVTVPLELPGGLIWSDGIADGNLSLRIVRYYDCLENRECIKLAVLFGVKSAADDEY